MDRLRAILTCAETGWLREVGDTLPLGLALTAGYLLATLAMLAVLLARQPVLHLPGNVCSGAQPRRRCWFWR